MREFLFRWRGTLIFPIVIVVLWIARPSPGFLMLGALLSLLGESLRLWALGYTGLPTRRQYLDAPVLVTAGPYAHVRNPLYVGNLLNGMAVAVAASGGFPLPSQVLLLGTCLSILLFVYGMIIPLEEGYLAEQHGECYRDYCRKVPAIMPRLTAAPGGQGDF
ncbi:MAG: isoprenylcysteine carboxylmethyltransferase family protein, partial [Candidatus Eremiobacterota bacterium]